MPELPQVSVVLPLYRDFAWLPEALQSLRRDGLDAWEAILVDDGSPVDPGPLLADSLKDPRFRLERIAHGGVAAARNAGARLARAPWLAFLDQDDLTLPGRFAEQLAAARDGGAAVVYSDYERVDEAGRVIDRYVSRVAASPEAFIRESLGDRGLAAMGTALIARDWFSRVGGFDPTLPGFDETDFFLRVAAAGGVFRYAPGVVHRWRDHAGNTMKSPEFQRARLAFVAKVERLAEKNADARAALSRFQARSWHALGLAHAERKEWKEAFVWCRKAWLKDPRRWEALYLALKALVSR